MQNKSTFHKIKYILHNRETKGNLNLISELLSSDKNAINHLEVTLETNFKEIFILNLASYTIVQPSVKINFLNFLLNCEPNLLLGDREIVLTQNDFASIQKQVLGKDSTVIIDQRNVTYSPLLIAIKYKYLNSVNLVLSHSLLQEQQKENPEGCAVKLSRAYMWAQRWYYKFTLTDEQIQILGAVFNAYLAITNSADEEQKKSIHDAVKRDYFNNLLDDKYYINIDNEELTIFLMSVIQAFGISHEDHIEYIRKFRNFEPEIMSNGVETITNKDLYAMIKMTDSASKDLAKSLKDMSISDKVQGISNQRS